MNMKRNTRKISILLVVVIICALGISMIPVTALAAEDQNYSSRVKITTDTNIVIPDGATYTYSKGISVEKGATLTISTEGEGTGRLVATSENNNVAAISVNAGSNLIINGGNIEVKTKTDDAAGIGGDKGKAAGNITINGGNITARSQSRGAAIGGGRNGGNERTNVNVYTDSVITAGKLSIESKYVGYYNAKQYHLYDTYTSDVFLGSASNLDAMSRIDDTNYQLTIIQPGVAVEFDSNGVSSENLY